MQAGMFPSFASAIANTYETGAATNGKRSVIRGLGGFYTGYGITIMREIPFSLVQFPLYEMMKVFEVTHLLSLNITTNYPNLRCSSAKH